MAELMIRKVDRTDIDGVMEVERLSFSVPWPKDIMVQELAENTHAHYFGMFVDGKMVGYAGMWHVIDDAQITTIAVIPDFRGQKLGEKLFLYVMQEAVRMGAKRLSLEVRVSNVAAQRMYRKFGLVPGGVRKNYYTDNQEDAIVMWVNLS
ncbi:ribosomal protein S18-alanine N-acetyltransferase [Lentibacillus juripiscarius]|uniref:[Ribosomal protein bS18]-alanine N-acetyltransferase n=1 Tax=Lentibacillus juripiscarius TaxID=257446 RepID=A0ABW5V497_9BACI